MQQEMMKWSSRVREILASNKNDADVRRELEELPSLYTSWQPTINQLSQRYG